MSYHAILQQASTLIKTLNFLQIIDALEWYSTDEGFAILLRQIRADSDALLKEPAQHPRSAPGSSSPSAVIDSSSRDVLPSAGTHGHPATGQIRNAIEVIDHDDDDLIAAFEKVEEAELEATRREQQAVDSSATDTSWVIYVLQCELGTYYVGKTLARNLMSRICEHVLHQRGRGSKWTAQYAPLDAVQVQPLISKFDEDTVTKEFMSQFGIQYVRGGTYCNTDLHRRQVQFLEQEILSNVTFDAISAISDVIFVLRCEDDKYYVGKTHRDLMWLIREHASRCRNFSEWTSRYAPLEVVQEQPVIGMFDEDTVTKKFMSDHGIENVRGGTYCSVELEQEQVALLEQEIRSSNNQCLRCGRAGHFTNSCHVTTDALKPSDRGGGGFAVVWSDGSHPGSFFPDPSPDH